MNLALLTDFYELSMAYVFWKEGIDQKEAVFHQFFRRAPFKGGFTVAAGLESLVRFLEEFRFSESDLQYLESLKFEKPFLEYLRTLSFSCDVDAVPEGTIVFPYEPLVRIKGPLIQCQMLESAILNLINFPTLIATKAARVCLAADGDDVFEFGLRRAQGIDGALTASRSAYIGGCSATSNVLAGKIFGIPVRGTHSHSFVMVYEDELEAFRSFAKHLPESSVFLVDTYNTKEGIKKAIQVGLELRQKGHTLVGIRLDSGDLAELSITARQLLDAAGFQKAKIYASNELDEIVISELKRQGAKINSWGVGTHLVTGKDQTALDGVYKLSAIEDSTGKWRDTLKLSEQLIKVSNPGILQVRRYKEEGRAVADVLYDERTELNAGCTIIDPLDTSKEWKLGKEYETANLLEPIFRRGKLVYKLPSLSGIRTKTQEELAIFPAGIKRFLNPHQYMAGMEKTLFEKKLQLIKRHRK